MCRRDPDGDSECRAYVAAGRLEDLLQGHADTHAQAFAERARVNDAWWRRCAACGWTLPAGLLSPRVFDGSTPSRRPRTSPQSIGDGQDDVRASVREPVR